MLKDYQKNQEIFDLIFIDPPYKADYNNILSNLTNNGWISKNSLVVIEMLNKDIKLLDENLIKDSKIKKYGDSAFIFVKN